MVLSTHRSDVRFSTGSSSRNSKRTVSVLRVGCGGVNLTTGSRWRPPNEDALDDVVKAVVTVDGDVVMEADSSRGL